MLSWQKQARFWFRAWRYRVRVEAAEIREVLRRVQPGQTVIDIGGHKGAFTYWLRKAVGPTGRVVTFEPQPELADYLRRSMGRLCFQNVTIVEAALSDQPGETVLYRAAAQASPGASLEVDPATAGHSVHVTMETLDRCLRRLKIEHVDFIKCDAEGHELSVFRGGESLLRACHPALLFECEQRHNRNRSIHEVFEFLLGLGYQGHFFCHNKLCPASHDQLRSADMPAEVYNYLFVGDSAAHSSRAAEPLRKSA